jgi:hypothetical protein
MNELIFTVYQWAYLFNLLIWSVSGLCCQLVFNIWNGIFNRSHYMDHDRTMKTDNWLWGFDQFIQSITTPKEESEMKMKSYAVNIEVTGRVTIYLSAPDYEEAEEIALEVAQNEDWNDWDLDLEVNGSEEDGDEDDN